MGNAHSSSRAHGLTFFSRRYSKPNGQSQLSAREAPYLADVKRKAVCMWYYEAQYGWLSPLLVASLPTSEHRVIQEEYS